MYNLFANFDFFELLGLSQIPDEQKSIYTSKLLKASLQSSLKELFILHPESQELERFILNLKNASIEDSTKIQQQLVDKYPQLPQMLIDQVNKLKSQALLKQISDFIKHIKNTQKDELLKSSSDLKTLELLTENILNQTDNDIVDLLKIYLDLKNKYNFGNK